MNKYIKIRLFDIKSITILCFFEIVLLIFSAICAIMTTLINIASLLLLGLVIVCIIAQIGIYISSSNYLIFYIDKIEVLWKKKSISYSWQDIVSMQYLSFGDIIALQNFTLNLWIKDNGKCISFESKYSVIPINRKKYNQIYEMYKNK